MQKSTFMAVLTAFLLLAGCSSRKPALQSELEDLVNSFPAKVGIAVISDTDTLIVGADEHFPLFSVVKFHQALAVAELMSNHQDLQPTDTFGNVVMVSAEELKPDTWSPMRGKYPDGGSFSVWQLMEFSLIDSDNNACDILYHHFATPQQVECHIKKLGITDCAITWTEEEQHKDPLRCYDNWTTPLAAARLLGHFYATHADDKCTEFVWRTMSKCKTGAFRIPKYIADQATAIVHKTGTGFVQEDGTVTGINDIACIILPDGSHIELAVFIKDAKCDSAICEELIASIAYRCVSGSRRRP